MPRRQSRPALPALVGAPVVVAEANEEGAAGTAVVVAAAFPPTVRPGPVSKERRPR